MLSLIDDPDEAVFETVCERFIQIGKPVVATLEQYDEQFLDATVHDRIALVIHKINFNEFCTELIMWCQDYDKELLYGGVLLSKYVDPQNNPIIIFQEIERIRRSIWLELNSYLTPLEKINIVNNIIFKHFKFKGSVVDFKLPQDFTLHHLINHKISNSFALSIMYASLAKMLDLPLYIINLPQQNLLAYFNKPYNFEDNKNIHDPKKEILFYVNPANGSLYNWENVFDYLKKIKKMDLNYFKPLHPHEILQHQFGQLALCYRNEKTIFKHDDLLHFIKLIKKYNKF